MKRLLIDLDTCSKCEECGMLCSYIQHPANNGITSLRELAHFAIICRKCDDAPCVASCPWEALEMQDYHALKRYMMRCTSCKSCSDACPFGTIIPETIPFVIAKCDYCLGRLRENEHPICLESCAYGGIRYGEFEENIDENLYKVSEYLLVKTAMKWERLEPAPIKKKL
ncbi:MAG: 4Fe-4S dicluster domain-containing protein [Candidatus Omnitrophota bacterium]